MHFKINNKIRVNKKYKPDIYTIIINNKEYLAKDIKNKAWYYKLIAKYFLKKEYQIYKRLSGIKGIPQLYDFVDGVILIIEYLNASPVYTLAKESVGMDFFDKLKNLIIKIHNRGIAHCDLRNRNNILIDKEHNPYIIDFNISFIKRNNFISKYIFQKFKSLDLGAISKIKMQVNEEFLTTEEKEYIKHPPFFEKTGFFLEKYYKSLKKRLGLNK